ncbi:hypothetical protein ACLBYD_27645 [Rhodococcus sp. C26F]
MKKNRWKWEQDEPLLDDPQAPVGVPMLIAIGAIAAILWAALR